MRTLQEIKKEHQDRLTQLLNDCNVFWAFNNEQFAEGAAKNPLQPGDKYVRIDGGGLLPKSKLPALVDGMKQLTAWYKEEVKKNDLRRTLIKYELANHECYYTGDIEDALNTLGEDYTREEVLQVFNEGNE